MSDKLFRISTPTIKYTIDDEFDMSRVASSRFIICNMGNKNKIVKENPVIEGMAFRTDLTQEETKKLNAGIISAQIHILLNNHKVIWTDIAKTTMNGVLGEDMFDVPDYSADTGEYEIDFHGTVSDYDVPLHGHLDVTLEGSTVIPNPEGEATDDLTKVEIDGEIFLVKDSTIYDWARAEEKPTYTKAEVGLDNVDNTSDLNKPISTATQTALDGKVDKDGDKVLSDNNYSDNDKDKLDGIEAEANKTVVDNSVTSTSTNPVESKAIYNLLNDLLPEATATGNPIAITNASGLNAKSLKVELEPIQDTSGGEPSPTNPCPISGRTQTTVSVNSEDTTIQFGQTVYGATVKSQGGTDIEFKKVSVISASNKVDLANTYRYTLNTSDSSIVFTDSSENISNCVKGVSASMRGQAYTFYVSGSNHSAYIDLPQTYDTVEKATQFVTSNNMEICCKLNTPTEISTPAFDIFLNKGNNTLTADGDMELIYSKIPQ